VHAAQLSPGSRLLALVARVVAVGLEDHAAGHARTDDPGELGPVDVHVLRAHGPDGRAEEGLEGLLLGLGEGPVPFALPFFLSLLHLIRVGLIS
jgi:hypothetical protein